jgi:adenylate cyclase
VNSASGRLSLGGEKSEVTILFSDIRGFTLMSALMEADEIVEMLNDYFSVLVQTLFRHDGTRFSVAASSNTVSPIIP